ncbi:hypothetical protein [Paenibacillus sp. Marseille-Q4541]|uniref:hypothetical protein n=1 Tax=Paenibacillus sp. Marseille-Q4541 TaxID=2831522 RepID=UPI001BA4D8A1|nr:hypothetical protein [Paenibacillus sp. Marseille-Q4541]
MRTFQFKSILRKYGQSYTLKRNGEGDYDADGVWIPANANPKKLKGSIQPISAKLRAAEGGNYSESDRMLFTVYNHTDGDLINHAGTQFRVVESPEREYSDVNQYVLRKVVANAPV